MTFKDIFKNSFLEGYVQGVITPGSIFTCLLITSIIGIYIFIAYRLLSRKSFYNKNFSISLVSIALITAAIILTVQSSIVISLGMVGALSIVRFRTAIKDPMDLTFLFWSISVGIICGAGLALIAVLLSGIMTLIIWLLNVIPVAKAPMLLLVTTNDIKSEEKIIEEVRKYSKSVEVKSRSFTEEQLDLVIEINSKEESKLSISIMDLDNVLSVSLVNHDGEVTF